MAQSTKGEKPGKLRQEEIPSRSFQSNSSGGKFKDNKRTYSTGFPSIEFSPLEPKMSFEVEILLGNYIEENEVEKAYNTLISYCSNRNIKFDAEASFFSLYHLISKQYDEFKIDNPTKLIFANHTELQKSYDFYVFEIDELLKKKQTNTNLYYFLRQAFSIFSHKSRVSSLNDAMYLDYYNEMEYNHIYDLEENKNNKEYFHSIEEAEADIKDKEENLYILNNSAKIPPNITKGPSIKSFNAYFNRLNKKEKLKYLELYELINLLEKFNTTISDVPAINSEDHPGINLENSLIIVNNLNDSVENLMNFIHESNTGSGDIIFLKEGEYHFDTNTYKSPEEHLVAETYLRLIEVLAFAISN